MKNTLYRHGHVVTDPPHHQNPVANMRLLGIGMLRQQGQRVIPHPLRQNDQIPTHTDAAPGGQSPLPERPQGRKTRKAAQHPAAPDQQQGIRLMQMLQDAPRRRNDHGLPILILATTTQQVRTRYNLQYGTGQTADDPSGAQDAGRRWPLYIFL